MANQSDGRSSLSRHLAILSIFDGDRPYLTLAQISAGTGFARSSAHRLVNELVVQGLLERQHDGTYRLGIRLWELASRVPGVVGLRETAAPVIHALHKATGQHVQLGILRGQDVLFLDRLSAPGAVVNVTQIGGRLPAAASTAGLILLAMGSEETREQALRGPLPSMTPASARAGPEMQERLRRAQRDGYVVADGYIHEDARGIAVPVRGVQGSVIASLSVVVPTSDTRTPALLSQLRESSAAITSALHSDYVGEGAEEVETRRVSRRLNLGIRASSHTSSAPPEHCRECSQESCDASTELRKSRPAVRC